MAFMDDFSLTPEEVSCICAAALPEDARKGIMLFNRGYFFDAHEALETAWRAEAGAGRELYRGILQVAVGYEHIRRGNSVGAIKMIDRAHRWLLPFPDRCQGVDLAAFRADYIQVKQAVLALGAERIAQFDRRLFHPIRTLEGIL